MVALPCDGLPGAETSCRHAFLLARLKLCLILNYIHVFMSLCEYEHMSVIAHGVQKRASSPPKVELQAVWTRAFGTELSPLQEHHMLLTAEPFLQS